MSTRVPLMELEEEFKLRLPKRVAAVVQATDQVSLVRAMAKEAEERLAGITANQTPVTMAPVDGKLKTLTVEQSSARQGFPVNEHPELYTRWFTTSIPQLCGWWDVTDSKTGTLNERWWFDCSTGNYVWYPKGPFQGLAGIVMHDEFNRRGLAWRGLREMPQEPYPPLPPYSPLLLPIEVGLNGQYIRRTRA